MDKIAIVTPGFLPVPAVEGGAVEVLITYLIEDNEKNPKYEIDLYTVDSPLLSNYHYKHTNIIPVKTNFLRKNMYRVICKGINTIYHMKNRNREIYYREILMYKKLKGKKYRYVIVENNMNLYKLIYKRTPNKENLIFHLHNDLGSMSKNEDQYEFIAKTSKLILTVSDYIRNRGFQVIRTNNVKRLYNCVDFKRFNPEKTQQSEEERKKYGLTKEDIVFMYSGRITKEKGILELLKAFSKMKKYPNAKLLIVGSSWFTSEVEDEYMLSLKKYAKDMKDQVVFTGYIYPERMPDVCGLADVVVVPTIMEEPFGVVVIEAMAMGKPLVVTNSGAFPEIVDDSGAFVVKKENNLESQLSARIEQLYLNKKLREEMGERSKERVHEIPDFNRDNYYKNFLQLLEE